MSVTGPTLPFLQEQVGSSISQVSYIFTARSIGVLTGSFMGKFCNKILEVLFKFAIAI